MNEWQPIETAPKDGRTLLLCKKSYEPFTGCWHGGTSENGRWIEGYSFDGKCGNEACFNEYLKSSLVLPTHWQPLLEGP